MVLLFRVLIRSVVEMIFETTLALLPSAHISASL
jgi:hypothetical protein